MTDEPDRSQIMLPSRRIVFSGLGALGVAAALAGCGASGDSGGAGGSSGSSGSGSSPSASTGTALAKTSDVPEGGGVILTDQKIVITQPTSGEFKAFTAVCTHQGFTVTSVADNKIECNHHGSEYSASTGEVEQGPASTALAEVSIKVEGDSILAA